MGTDRHAPTPAGRAEALDPHFEHGRVDAGDLSDMLDEIAQRWIDHHASGRSVAVTVETNEHLALLSGTIQRAPPERGRGPCP